MTKAQLITTVTRAFHKVGFMLRKHSPEILIVAGAVGTVASTVMACKATTKLDTVLSESKEKVDAIHKAAEKKEANGKPYTEKDKKQDLAKVYAHTGLNLVKLYGPSVLLGAASLTSILTSHNIIRKRNIALAAAYATVDSGFKEYRGRVVERFGEQLDKELKYNIKAQEVEKVVVDEKGEEKIVKETVTVAEINEPSDYARFFDTGSSHWTKDPEYNLMFLKRQQDYANEKLKARGHLFLNEVYDMLDINRSRAGSTVGWVYDPKNPELDNYVSFGIYDVQDAAKRRFVNGDERSILLDFNVDGDVWDLMS